jgi:hypothetical protein
MTPPKTQPTAASVDAYIASRANATQAADCQALIALLGRLSGEPPVMWGPSIVGFGRYRYRTAGGRPGEMCRVGFAIRQRELVVYLLAEGQAQAALRARLGPHRMGQACLYLKRLADVDLGVLDTLVTASLAEIARRHGAERDA